MSESNVLKDLLADDGLDIGECTEYCTRVIVDPKNHILTEVSVCTNPAALPDGMLYETLTYGRKKEDGGRVRHFETYDKLKRYLILVTGKDPDSDIYKKITILG